MTNRYDAPPNADSQCGMILRLLKSRAGEWVPLPEILELGCAQYNTRIKELRDEWGFPIENRTETVNGERHSWFRLVVSPNAWAADSESDFMRQRHEEEARENPLFARGAA